MLRAFLQLLNEDGHWLCQDTIVPRGYTQVPYSHEQAIGLFVHELLSIRPRAMFLTDGASLFFPGDKPLGQHAISRWDVLGEDLLLQILDARPANVDGLYSTIDGHVRISDFTSCFAGYDPNGQTEYSRRMAVLTSSDAAQYEIAQLKNRIRERAAANRDSLRQLVAALHNDEPPLPGYAAKLEETLRDYGYVHPRPAVPV